jgi:hypothetical protein
VLRLFVVVVVLAAGVLAVSASASVPAGVPAKAKHAASVYVQRFGITYAPSSWHAGCRPVVGLRRTWRCAVRTNSGQCKGTLRVIRRLTGRLVARRIRIGCGE